MPPKKILRSGKSPRQRKGNIRFLDTVENRTTPSWTFMNKPQPHHRWTQIDDCDVCKESMRAELDAFNKFEMKRAKKTKTKTLSQFAAENATMHDDVLQQCLDELGELHTTCKVHNYSREQFEEDTEDIDSPEGLITLTQKIQNFHPYYMYDHDDLCREYFLYLASKARMLQTKKHRDSMEKHILYCEQHLPYVSDNPYLAFKVRTAMYGQAIAAKMKPYTFDDEAHKKPEHKWFKALKSQENMTMHPRVVSDMLGPMTDEDQLAAELLEETFRRTDKPDATFIDEERFLGPYTREEMEERKEKRKQARIEELKAAEKNPKKRARLYDVIDMDISIDSTQKQKRRKLEDELGFPLVVDETEFHNYGWKYSNA